MTTDKHVFIFQSAPNYRKGEKGFKSSPNPKLHRVSVMMSSKQKKILDEHCTKLGMSVSDFIRQAIGHEMTRTMKVVEQGVPSHQDT